MSSLASVSYITPQEARVAKFIKDIKSGEKKEARKEDAELLSGYLIKDSETSGKGGHWYCKKASELVKEVATYCQIWLVATREVEALSQWKKAYKRILENCIDCVRGMEDALLGSQYTYLSVYQRGKIEKYIDVHNEWNVSRILGYLQSPNFRNTLDELPPPIFYHILYNPALLAHPKIWPIVRNLLPSRVVSWMPRPAPAGFIFLLLIPGTPRNFVSVQLQKTPLPTVEEVGSRDSHYVRAYNAILVAMANSTDERISLPSSSLLYSMVDGTTSESLWSSIPTIIQRFKGVERARIEITDRGIDGKKKYATFLGLTINHLSRHDQAFPHVAHAFESSLRLWVGDAWLNHPNDLPLLALDALKENQYFLRTCVESSSSISHLGWVKPYLRSILSLSSHSKILHRVFQVFMEELQHERFAAVRPIFLAYFFSALTSIHNAPIAGKHDHRRAIANTVNIHSEAIVAVAFSKRFSSPEWQRTRKLWQTFMTAILNYDVSEVQSVLTRLPDIIKHPTSTNSQFSSPYSVLWGQIRAALRGENTDTFVLLIRTVASSSHLVPLRIERLSYVDGKKQNVASEVGKLLRSIQIAIDAIQAGFDDQMLRLVDATQEQALSAFCERDDVSPYLLPLLFSSRSSLSSGAQTLLGEAYTADGRVGCIRILLENQCHVTIEAMISHLKCFLEFVPQFVESVELAKSFVLCYTDSLEVLCSRGSGLLFDEKFKNKHRTSMKALAQLWKHMCQVAGLIIERTPEWARRYPSNEMVPWMRDGLIFANELIAQRRVFETAILEASDPMASLSSSPSKLSSHGVEMVADFGRIMRPLGSWLRLTNQELLERSYTLLMDLFEAFKEARQTPEEKDLSAVEDTINRWQKRLQEDTKASGDASRKDAGTRLSLAQLGTLIRRIKEVRGEEDSDVEFISQSFSPRKPPPIPKPKAQKIQTVINFHDALKMHKKPATTKGLVGRPAEKAKLTTKGVGLVDKLRKDAESFNYMAPPRLEDEMVRRAIQERQAAKSSTSVTNLSSSGDDTSQSSSESESENEGGPSGLAQLSKLHKSPAKARAPAERKGVILLNKATTIKTSTSAHAPTPARVRYIPDLTPLHRIILGWDYKHDGLEPPTNGNPLSLKEVPDTFSSHRHYLDVFHSLLMVECWNSLTKSKDERLEKVKCTVSGKMFADLWVEIDVSIEKSTPRGWTLTETDILLMERDEGINVLAKVHSARQTRDGLQATLRYSTEVPSPDIERAMALQSSWKISRVFSLSTVHREYTALMGIGQYDWADTVFQARMNSPATPSEPSIQNAMAAYRLNYPQARAVLSSLETAGFSLIQGPPGTGKTSTICGIVGAFLSNRRQPTTLVQTGKAPPKTISRKALVCAPSNAAIDEVAKRLSGGIWASDGTKFTPKVVRLGADNVINVSVKAISLDNLINDRLSNTNPGTSGDSTDLVASLRSELDRLKQLRQQKHTELESPKASTATKLQIEQELRDLSSQRIQLSTRLTAAMDKNRDAARAIESARRKARLDILNECDVICTTLSGSGHDVIEHFEFDLVVIDEAAQAIELSSLIPLKFSFDRCILVGDPQQLPPTVISQTATRLLYNQSLFVRLQKARPGNVHLLSIQYRMHPEISHTPSLLFYGGKLADAPEMALKTAQPWHQNHVLGVYRFFDVRGVEEQADTGHSQFNLAEVKAALSIYRALRRGHPDINFDYRIGVVSMYRAQLSKLKDAFATRYGPDILSRIDFNTVDGFQGQEKDVIILSCVRAGPGLTSIGFLSDIRRINVAITRSRSSLYILGNSATLKRSDATWEKIIENACDRGLFIQATESLFPERDISKFEAQNSLKSSLGPAPSMKTKLTTPISDATVKPAPTAPKSMVPAARAEIHVKEVSSRSNLRSVSEEGPSSNASRNGAGKGPFMMDTREDNLSDSRNIQSAVPVAPSSVSHPSAASGSNPPTASRPRQPPKPIAANLFIPKKPVAKRPAPSDASLPNAKRRPP